MCILLQQRDVVEQIDYITITFYFNKVILETCSKMLCYSENYNNDDKMSKINLS